MLHKRTKLRTDLLGNQQGFSLLEIIIVLGILAGLAAVLYGNLSGAQESAKKKDTSIRASQVYQKLLRYNTDKGKYPSTEEGLTALTAGDGGTPYAEEDELKDAWGNQFEYELSPKGPKLTSPGPDGQSASGDDLVFVNGKEQGNAAQGAPAATPE